MRARFQPPSYFELVNLQPDSPEKEKLQQYASESADAEHAGFLYRNLLAMQANIEDLQMRLRLDRAQRADVAPGLIRLHIAATRQHERMQTALQQLRENTYRNACSRLYVETGWRIGPQEWPDATPQNTPRPQTVSGMAALEAAFAKFTDAVEKLPAKRDAKPPAESVAAETPPEQQANTGTAPETAPQPISHKRIKPLLKSLSRAGVDAQLCEQIKRDALDGKYEWGQLRQKVSDMVGAA
ncbi:MAG: hypothetical protein IPP14_11260 [Planctomycetes bacterium]|nr:hypothetical protein [Planctomycetota bacterium]